MNRLKKSLTTACVGITASSSVLAFEPQDYGKSTATMGGAVSHIHTVWAYDTMVCGSTCQPYNTESSYSQYVYRTPDASPGVSETLTCDIPTTDASGNPVHGTIGDTPDLIMSYSYNEDFLYTPNFDPTFDGLNGGFASPIIGGTIPFLDCEVTTDALGKITDGWMMRAAFHPTPALFSYTFHDFTNKTFSIVACTAQPTIGEMRAMDFAAIASGDNASLPEGCTELFFAQKINYLTCDIDQQCGQFGKSVPVPTFAAVALGFGLVGVSYLTSTRRRLNH